MDNAGKRQHDYIGFDQNLFQRNSLLLLERRQVFHDLGLVYLEDCAGAVQEDAVGGDCRGSC